MDCLPIFYDGSGIQKKNENLKAENIDDMKLYQDFVRVENELNRLKEGRSENEPLKASDLYRFDTMHYHGVDSVRESVEPLLNEINNASESVSVLDFGSGLGGPARFMADELKCKVTAVELQEGAHQLAKKLTKDVGLSEHVK